MINEERVVSVTKTDLLSLYTLILALTVGSSGATLVKAEASDNMGDFEITEAPAGGVIIANEPVKTIDIGEDVTAATIYFVAGYDYAGFTLAGTAVETAGDEVDPDGVSLYKAELASGVVTITKQGL